MTKPQTFAYSRVGDLVIHVDIYLPPATSLTEKPLIPGVLFFHGGGIFRGSRKTFLPEFKDEVISRGWSFISADYRLLLPSTGHDILADITALFAFISTTLPTSIDTYQIDSSRLFVSGHSGGAYVARQAALHGNPKPKALFSLSGQGGELLMPHYFTPSPQFPKKLLGTYRKYSDPNSNEFKSLKPCSDFAGSWPTSKDPNSAPGTRPFLSSMASLSGTRLDFLTGKPGLSKQLLSAFTADQAIDIATFIPDDVKILFPELQITAGFPPTFIVHGTGDKSVLVRESEKTASVLKECGVECTLVLVENWGHGYSKGVYDRWIKGVIPFFERQLE